MAAIARHPKTGAAIRIITSDASTWRDQKTLVWLDDPATLSASDRWSRWDTGVSSRSALDAAVAAGVQPDVIVCLGPTEDWEPWFATGDWSSARLVAVPKQLVEFIGLQKLASFKITNMLCLDEMTDLYPFTGGAWDGTSEDAKALIALSLHMGRTFPVSANPVRTALAEQRGLRMSVQIRTPPPLWLLGQYYKPEKARRRKEIETCLQKNLECPLVDRVVLLNETACAPSHPKLQEEVLGKRLTYAAVLRWICDNAPEDCIIAFANSDIFLDTESFRLLWSTDLTGKCFALLRWDVESAEAEAVERATLFGPRADSQDTWIVSAASVRAAFSVEKIPHPLASFEFPFGQGGCDNAVALEMFRNKFVVVNPALSLKTYHLHTSAVRTYDPADIVSKPAYLYIHPTGLHDMRPVLTKEIPGATHTTLHFKSFARPVLGPLTPAQAKTFCTMVARTTGGRVTLEADSQNLWTPEPVSVYQTKDVFETREGLVYTYDSLLVGPSKAAQEAWSSCQLSSMSASLSADDALVAPLPDSVATNPHAYLLQYLAKIFLLRDKLGVQKGEFWCAKNPACIETIKMFQWPDKEVPVLSRDETHQAWCKRAAVWPSTDAPLELITQEEVEALRSSLGLGGWLPTVDEEARLVVVIDGKWVTDEMAEGFEIAVAAAGIPLKVECVWAGRTDLSVVLGLLRGAWGVVAATNDYSRWFWTLPVGAYVWEIQNEMEPSATLLHLSCAARLQHRLTITGKGVPSPADLSALRVKLFEAIQVECAAQVLSPSSSPRGEMSSARRPPLFLPTGHTGFFSHAGDSFREMARLWAERGFVDLVESPTVHQVWLEDTGSSGILLYDRPTLDWLKAAPAKETKAALTLYGNPSPVSSPGPGLAWTFWPRRPRLVEGLVARGLPATPFEARADTLVFYGRSENQVQRANRSRADWSKVCDKWHHVQGATGVYPFTQEEYLEKLAKARYGLCLAGYGRKCHREVECMAMGCVPICSPEVDMTSYADPPKVGVHYFRVTSPEEAAHVVKNMPPERWATMSAACRDWWARNASAEGSWALTTRLVQAASGGTSNKK